MISNKKFYELKEGISKEARIIKEINSFFNNPNSEDNEEKEMIHSQINLLKNDLRKENEKVSKILKNIYLTKPLPQVMNKTRNFMNIVIMLSLVIVIKGGLILILKNKKNASTKIDAIKLRKVEKKATEI